MSKLNLFDSSKSYQNLKDSNIELDFYYSKSLCKSLEKQHTPHAQENCCVCGNPDLLITCDQRSCRNSFHFYCVSAYFPELLTDHPICPAHSFKSLSDYSKLIHLSSKSNHSPIQDLIKTRPDYKKELELSGKLFWLAINFQYFPNFNSAFPPPSAAQPRQSSSWIDLEIEKNVKELSSVHTKNQTFLPSPAKTSHCRSPKLGENLSSCCKLPETTYKKLVKAYEKTLIKTMNFVPRDYQGFQSEDKIICAVCDDGSSLDSNLIVICSGCSLPVHCKCYNILAIPEDDWLCDPCLENKTDAQCSLCPIKKGALKRAKPNSWVHVSCARYLQKSFLNEQDFDIRKIEKEKFKLQCFSCQTRKGACVRCFFPKCSASFHIECRKDLFEIDSQNQVLWVCPGHKASRITRIVNIKQEVSLDYIKKIAAEFWEQEFSKEAQNREREKERERERDKEKEKNSGKKKFVIEMFGKTVRIKMFVGGKVVKVMKFLEDKGLGRETEEIEGCCEMKCNVFESREELLIASEKNGLEVQIDLKKDFQLIKKRKCGEI